MYARENDDNYGRPLSVPLAEHDLHLCLFLVISSAILQTKDGNLYLTDQSKCSLIIGTSFQILRDCVNSYVFDGA